MPDKIAVRTSSKEQMPSVQENLHGRDMQEHSRAVEHIPRAHVMTCYCCTLLALEPCASVHLHYQLYFYGMMTITYNYLKHVHHTKM